MSERPSPNRSPRDRAEARRRARRKTRIQRLTLVIVVALLVIAAAVKLCMFAFSSIHSGASPKDSANANADIGSAVTAQTEKTYEPASVSLIAVGDNLIHNSVYEDAYVGNGEYDFTPMYEDIKPYVQAADIAVINQESPLGTGPASGYPCFNTPQACGDALIDAGFDVISHANNHAMDSGADAIYDTLDYWDSHADDGVIRIGIARDAKDRAKIRYLERNGMKIAFLAYTYDLNGYSLPSDNPDLVSLIDKDTIAKEIAAAKKKCDAVVVMMHWGVEYELEENEEQDDLAKFLTENGATLIIGGHPHVVEPCEWVESDNGNRAFCIYSTGNFISAQDTAARIVEGMLQVTLTRQKDGSVVVENPGVMPMVCTSRNWRHFKVIPMDDYTSDMASAHTLAGRSDVSVSNVNHIADTVFGDYRIEKTIPTTYCTQESEKSDKSDSDS